MKGLIEIHFLKDLLGYDDLRSIRAWCRKNNVPLVVLGKRTYTQRHLLDKLIAHKLGADNAIQVSLEGIRKNELTDLANTNKTVNSTPKRKERKRSKINYSQASTTLLKNIHSAD